MLIFRSLFPILLFIGLYFGTGLYYHNSGYENAFYKISPLVFIFIASIPAILFSGKSIKKTIDEFVEGISDNNILTMCIIFLLSSAFSVVTKSIGAPQIVVNLVGNYVHPDFLLPMLFIAAAIMSTSLGTSMGVIALILPISLGFSEQFGIPKDIIVGTIIGAAMFGDNLSMISDTTIASVMSQKASFNGKFMLNLKIASIAGFITICMLLNYKITSFNGVATTDMDWSDLIKIVPYIIVLSVGVLGLHAFISLTIGVLSASFIGGLFEYEFITFANDIKTGFLDMHEVIILSLFIGGISKIAMSNGIVEEIEKNLISKIKTSKAAELFIAFTVSIIDILVANNTIAILISGHTSEIVGNKLKISADRRANILSIFSCVFQGIIPYGAQMLLAIQLSNCSYIDVLYSTYYCFVLGIVAILDILFRRKR